MTWVTKSPRVSFFLFVFPFSLTNQDTFTLENILKKYIFPSSKHELGAGTAGFTWYTPARYYGTMCFLKECFKILYSLRASQLRPLPCWQSVFSRPCSLAPWPWLPGYKILFVISEMLILMESNGFTFFPNINLGEFLFQRKTY